MFPNSFEIVASSWRFPCWQFDKVNCGIFAFVWWSCVFKLDWLNAIEVVKQQYNVATASFIQELEHDSQLKILWMSPAWSILSFWCNLKLRISLCLNFPFWNHMIVLARKLAQNNCSSHPWLMKHYLCTGHLCSCFLCFANCHTAMSPLETLIQRAFQRA